MCSKQTLTPIIIFVPPFNVLSPIPGPVGDPGVPGQSSDPIFSATLGAPVIVLPNSSSKLPVWSVLPQPPSFGDIEWFNPATGVFTVQNDGTYFVSFEASVQVFLTGAPTLNNVSCQLWRNDVESIATSTLSAFVSAADDPFWLSFTLQRSLEFAAGDTLEIRAVNDFVTNTIEFPATNNRVRWSVTQLFTS